MSKRTGFTLNDLLAAVAIVALSAPLVLGFGRSRELARQAYCKTNLSNIGKGLGIYTASSMDTFPWMNSDHQWDAATGASQQAAPSDKTNYNVSALLFVLVRDNQDANIFLCPSTRDTPDPHTKTKTAFNWDFSPYKDGNAEHVSYSYQAPLVTVKDKVATTTSGVTANSDSGLVVVADRSPAYEGLKPDFNWAKPGKDDPNLAMSQNHGGAIINLLYADLHVGESKGRADAGIFNDNIYSAAGSGADGKTLETNQGPGTMKLSDHRSPKDSFLLGPKKMEK